MKTRTSYTIEPAHSGTDRREIEKAKRMYRKHAKRCARVKIVFTDTNNCIYASFYDLDDPYGFSFYDCEI